MNLEEKVMYNCLKKKKHDLMQSFKRFNSCFEGGKEENGQCHLPYKILSEAWRRIHYEEVGQAASHCDTSLHPGWYR